MATGILKYLIFVALFLCGCSQTTVHLYSRYLSDAQIEEINELSGLGWEIHHTSMLFIDNHWYKENSIALMLVPSGENPQEVTNQQDWANEYTSQNCNTDLIIKLQLDGIYQILNLNGQLLKHGLTRGTWNITHFPYLELKSKTDDWSFYFEVQYYAQTDRVGEIQIFELSPIDKYTFLDNCSFVFGIRP
jgi:hypothetical protein